MSMPTLFVSHGAPDLVLSRRPAVGYLKHLGDALPRPAAIVVISAHWIAGPVGITGAAQPETIHDFYGFPDALYDIEYPAAGAPALAERVFAVLEASGVAARIDPKRGIDHGVWAPLLLMYPQADVPVVQVSLPRGSLQSCIALGEALAPLREEGVLILGSGSTVHNLRAMNLTGETSPWAVNFEEWLLERVTAGDLGALAEMSQWPLEGSQAHPTPEHLAPLLVAWAAAGAGAPGQRLHTSFDYGNIGMSCFAFGEEVPAVLADPLAA